MGQTQTLVAKTGIFIFSTHFIYENNFITPGILVFQPITRFPAVKDSYPSSVMRLHPLMGLRTGSERDTCRGTEGAQTSTHTELRSVPSANSTFAQVLPSPDSLPSTKMAEQLLLTWGQRRERK